MDERRHNAHFPLTQLVNNAEFANGVNNIQISSIETILPEELELTPDLLINQNLYNQGGRKTTKEVERPQEGRKTSLI